MRRWFKFRHLVAFTGCMIAFLHVITCAWYIAEAGVDSSRSDLLASGHTTSARLYLETLNRALQHACMLYPVFPPDRTMETLNQYTTGVARTPSEPPSLPGGPSLAPLWTLPGPPLDLLWTPSGPPL